MKTKDLLSKLMLLLAVLLAGAGSAWADGAYKTLSFPDDNSSSNKNGDYTSTWTAKKGNDSWTITNFNNNSWNNWTYIKCGRKNNASVGTITTSAAIDKPISKVVVTIDNVTTDKVNSSKLYVSTESSFPSANVQTISVNIAKGEVVFTVPTPTAECYYKLEFDCASASANGVIQLSKVEYYASESSEIDPSKTDIATLTSITPSQLNIGDMGDFTLNATFAGGVTEDEDYEISWESSNTNVLEVAGSTYEAKAAGKANVTVSVTVLDDETYNEVSKTFEVNVVDPNAGDGTQARPYSVAEALAANAATGVYVKGTISAITEVSTSYGNATYTITDGVAEMTVYRGKYLNNTSFTSENQIQVGDKVVVYGNLSVYNSVNQLAQNNYLYSLTRKEAANLAFGEASYTVGVGGNLTITATSSNSNGAITYTSSATDIATIDANTGVVTAKAEGTTTITATIAETEDYAENTAEVILTVTDNRQAIVTIGELTPTTVTKGDLNEFSLTITPVDNTLAENTDYIVVWSSSNSDILELDDNTYEAKAKGTVTVKVEVTADNSTLYKDVTKEFTVTVNNATHNAVFYALGELFATVPTEEGEAITFPATTPAEKNGYSFVGWAKQTIQGTTNEKPTLYTKDNMGNADVNYYAVYAEVEKGTKVSKEDALDRDLTGVTSGSTSYSNWSNKSVANGSGAVYAGNSAGGNNSIQLRSDASKDASGIITTTSGGNAKKVVLNWNSNTASGRTVNVYGKNSAYESVADLRDNSKQGTQLGSISNGTTELTIEGDYAYIGIASSNGAMYLSSVTITWESGTPDTYKNYCTTVSALPKPVITLSATEITMQRGETGKTITANASYTDSNDEEQTIAANLITLTSSDQALTIDADGAISCSTPGEYTITATVEATEDYQAATATATVTVTKAIVTLAWSAESANVTYSEEPYNLPTLNNPEGVAVTYNSSNTSVATIDNEGNVEVLNANGTTTITVSFDGDDNYEAKTATYELTVVKKIVIEDGVFDFALGTNYGSGVQTTTDGNHYEDAASTWTAGNVTLVASGSYRWWNNDNTLRFKKNDGTMTISVADGYVITGIAITGGQQWTTEVGTYSSSNGKWSGFAKSVELTQVSDKANNVKTVTVTYIPNPSVTIGEAKWATYVPAQNVSFENVTAYIVSNTSTTSVTLTEVAGVPAGTPVLVNSETPGTYELEIIGDEDCDDVTANKLQVSNGTDAQGNDIYVLANKNNNVGFYRWISENSLSAGKVYLQISGASNARLVIVFDGDETGVNAMDNGQLTMDNVYNLQGVRVSAPTKGLYIVNGKKVVVK